MPIAPFDPPTASSPAAIVPFDPVVAPVSASPVRGKITALTGGGANALDGQITATGLFATNDPFIVVTSAGASIWQLEAGTQATNVGAGYVRPADYDASTNPRVFVRQSWQNSPGSFEPAFVEVAGSGGLQSLDADVSDATAGKIITGTIGGVLRNYQVRAGTDAEDLPGIVHPANYDAETNAIVFVQL